MYVARKYKFICSFILIILLTFCSVSGTILNSNAHASVVAGGLSLKALWVALSAIAAGVVFTSPGGVEDFVEDAIGFLEGTTGGVIYNDKEWIEFQKQLDDKFNDLKKKAPKPPDPKKMKNGLLWLGGSAAVLIDKLVDWLNGKDDSNNIQGFVLGGVNIFPVLNKSGSNFYFNVSTGNTIMWDHTLGESIPSNSDGLYITGINSYNLSGSKVNVVFSLKVTFKDENIKERNYNNLSIKIPISEFDSDFIELLTNVGVVTKPQPIVPSHQPIVLPPGVTLPNGTPAKSKPGTAPVLPMPYPSMPNVPNPDWSDFGFDVEVVPNPNPGTNPDSEPHPDPVPDKIQQPVKYPDIGPNVIGDYPTGVQPGDLVGLDKAGLGNWLQNNTYNFTNNTYNNVSDFDIDDPDFDKIDFDFTPLTNIGQALVRKFPFCIPFDLIDSIKLLAGKPVPPKFTLPFRVNSSLNGASQKADIVIDFEQFEKLALISRVSFTLIYIVALMFVTSKTIKW